MIFQQPKAVLYLKKDGFELCNDEGSLDLKAEFPKGSVKDLEIKNVDELNNAIRWFVQKNELKPLEVLIVLSEEILFYKPLYPKEPDNTSELIERFIEEIPLEKSKVSVKVINLENEKVALATNRELYESVMVQLSRHGWKVSSVVPVLAYGRKSSLTSPLEIRHFLEDQASASANFLVEGNIETSSLVPEIEISDSPGSRKELSSGSKLKTVILSILAFTSFFLFIALLGLAIATFLRPEFPSRQEGPSALIEKSTIESSPSALLLETTPSANIGATASSQKASEAKSSFILRKDIRVRILNGSGRAGEAAKVASMLKDLGFKEVTTDNAPSYNNPVTKITYLPQVSKKDIEEVTGKLKKIFTQVNQEQDQNLEDFDVTIATGKN